MKKMDLLVAVYIFCICVAEMMGGKTIPLFSIGEFQLNVSVAIFVVPLLFTINDVITEVYGPARTRSVIRSGLVVIALILVVSLFFTWLPPSARFAGSESAYDTVFGVSARIAAASLTAFAVAEFLDVAVFLKLKRRWGKKALWFRNNASNFIAQLFDTILFISLAFYAFDQSFAENVPFLIGLIIPYWLLKCAMSVLETPLVYLGIRWLKSDLEELEQRLGVVAGGVQAKA